MSILQFPPSDRIAKAYVSRLNVQQEEVDKAVAGAEQSNANLMMQMQKYLFILQNFIQDASPAQILEFIGEEMPKFQFQLFGDIFPQTGDITDVH